MSKFSKTFMQLWAKGNRGINIEEYNSLISEYQNNIEGAVVKHSIILVVGILLGVWAAHENSGVLAGIAFLVAGRSYFKSSQFMLMKEILSAQAMLAMLIQSQNAEIAALRMAMPSDQRSSEIVSTGTSAEDA